jgi:hypothetical protein
VAAIVKEEGNHELGVSKKPEKLIKPRKPK